MDTKLKNELYKLLRYAREIEGATGYKRDDRPNYDYISRKLSEEKCLKDA